MAKLRGKAKEEFLKRMKRGRAKAKPAKTPKKTSTAKTKKTNPRPAPPKKRKKAMAAKRKGTATKRKRTMTSHHAKPQKRARRNPDDLASAESMYEKFHQKVPGKIIEYDLPYHYPENFAELGKLKELRVFLDKSDPEFPITSFGECQVVCTPDGKNIYFVGGDQAIDLGNFDISSDKDEIDLGPCIYICYHTMKGFHDFQPTDYEHDFGEEDGIFPRLCYNRLNQRLYLISGNYEVKREGIVN